MKLDRDIQRVRAMIVRATGAEEVMRLVGLLVILQHEYIEQLEKERYANKRPKLGQKGSASMKTILAIVLVMAAIHVFLMC